MIYDRYYYSILDKREKQIYKRIYNGIENLEDRISFGCLTSLGIDLDRIVEYIMLDNPHIFYVDFGRVLFSESEFEKSVEFIYLYSKPEIAELKKKIDTTVGNMLKKVYGKNEYEIEKSVHDLIIYNVLYDHVAVQNHAKYASRANTILGVLFYKTAVCEGIASTVKLLLNMCDIKCIVAVGKSLRDGLPHAWNIVKIDEQNYHLDVTWDLPTNGSYVIYDYFNLTDLDMRKDHALEDHYPICNSIRHNYFVVNNLIAENDFDIVRIAQKKGTSKSINFKYAGNLQLKEVANMFFNLLKRNMTYSLNEEQGTILAFE